MTTRSRSLDIRDRRHFFGCAAKATRQIILDNIRALAADKRGGGLHQVTLPADLGGPSFASGSILTGRRGSVARDRRGSPRPRHSTDPGRPHSWHRGRTAGVWRDRRSGSGRQPGGPGLPDTRRRHGRTRSPDGRTRIIRPSLRYHLTSTLPSGDLGSGGLRRWRSKNAQISSGPLMSWFFEPTMSRYQRGSGSGPGTAWPPPSMV